jgi:hypothetical protein
LDGADAAPVPTEFVAVTVKVYAVPLVNPVTVIGLDVPVAVKVVPPPVGVAVTAYEVIALPPLDEGAAKLTVACPLPAVSLTPVGAPGTVIPVTLSPVEFAPFTVTFSGVKTYPASLAVTV